MRSFTYVEPVKHLRIGRDRRDVAGGDRFSREPHHGRQTLQLQLGVLSAAVDRALLQLLGDNLPDARDVHAFLRSDFVAGETLPKLGGKCRKRLAEVGASILDGAQRGFDG